MACDQRLSESGSSSLRSTTVAPSADRLRKYSVDNEICAPFGPLEFATYDNTTSRFSNARATSAPEIRALNRGRRDLMRPRVNPMHNPSKASPSEVNQWVRLDCKPTPKTATYGTVRVRR